jgi:hypothetical protein
MVQVRALCEKAKEILMEESNVQVHCFDCFGLRTRAMEYGIQLIYLFLSWAVLACEHSGRKYVS